MADNCALPKISGRFKKCKVNISGKAQHFSLPYKSLMVFPYPLAKKKCFKLSLNVLSVKISLGNIFLNTFF